MKLKKILMLILAFVLLMGVIPVYPSYADESQSSTNYMIKFRDVEQGITALGNSLMHKYKFMPMVTAKLNEAQLALILSDGNVEFIEEDHEVVVSSTINSVPRIENFTGSQEISEDVSTITSPKTRVAVMDTGSWQGDALPIAGGASFVGDRSSYKDDHGHGTYVASILKNTAPDVTLYALKVLNEQGIGTYSAIIEALEWAVTNDMQMVNMSFGGQNYSLALAEAMNMASDHGMLLFAAAGNNGSATLDYPARFNNVIAVGSVDSEHQKSAFSNTGNELEFVALGEEVPGLGRDGEAFQQEGTSVSVPQVAGVAALYMGSFPTLSKDAIRELLRTNAVSLGPADQYGYGLARYKVEDEQAEEPKEEIIEETVIEPKLKVANEDMLARLIKQLSGYGEEEDLALLGEQRLQIERDRLALERKLQTERMQLEADRAMLSKEDVMHEFGVSDEWIQQQLDEGNTLQDIFAHLWQANEKTGKKSHVNKGLTEKIKQKKTVNHSQTAISEIKSDIGNHINNNIEKVEYIDLNDEVAAAKEELQNSESQFSVQNEPPEEIIVPVEKSSEAPYTVGLHGENVSLLSGSLSLSSTDLTLPGRGGLSFTLGRTYNSAQSQLYEMDVNYSDTMAYEFTFKKLVMTRPEQYDLTRRYDETIVKYACSGSTITSGPLWSSGTGYVTSVNAGTYYTMQSLDNAKNNPPALADQTVHACNTNEANRIYIKKFTYSGSTHTTYSYGWGSGYIDDSYASYNYSTVLDYRNSMASGNLNTDVRGGSYSGGYYNTITTYSNVGNVYSFVVGVTPYNTTKADPIDNRFPIGKGWRWNIPFLKFESGKTYVSLQDGSVYEVNGSQLKNYPWSDLSFVSDNSVSYSGRQSAYALKSVYGMSQYFDSAGNLVQIKDAHENTISYAYTNVSPYGVVLTSITDVTGNSIAISYSTSKVELTLGDRKVTYHKTTSNGKEMLSQVIDPMGRVSTYNYNVKPASFNLLGSTPSQSNPYALLTSVVHPTGVKSVYTYEVNPVSRFIGNNQVNQAYRIASRIDEVTYSNQLPETFNPSSIVYSGDMGSSYSADSTFHTTLFNGLLETKMVYTKDYVNSNVGNVYYNTQVVQNDGEIERITDMTYDQQKYRTNPISTTTKYRNISTGATSTSVAASQVFDDYQNVLSETSPIGAVSTYTYDTGTRRLVNSNVPTDSGQSVYTEVVSRNTAGDVTEMILRDSGSSGAILSHVQYTYDGYGNVTLIRNKETNRDIDTQIVYSNVYGHAYPTQIIRPYTDVDGQAHTQIIGASYDKPTGLMLSYTDGNNNTTSYTYDKLNRLTKLDHPDGNHINIVINDTLNETTGVCQASCRSPLNLYS